TDTIQKAYRNTRAGIVLVEIYYGFSRNGRKGKRLAVILPESGRKRKIGQFSGPCILSLQCIFIRRIGSGTFDKYRKNFFIIKQ
ncbi:MAG TPA: hypothetical protein DCL77_13465, partial [Prolixibacteraceae bacterium]|nr:hypothetical protein [Prolixibacteraceae bacterium]